MALRDWLRRRWLQRRARRLLEEAILDPRLRAGTSLRPRHRSRTVIWEVVERDGAVARIRFGIVRHPRPYAFSSQAHRVLEAWSYDVETGRFTRERGHDLTREAGRDAD